MKTSVGQPTEFLWVNSLGDTEFCTWGVQKQHGQLCKKVQNAPKKVQNYPQNCNDVCDLMWRITDVEYLFIFCVFDSNVGGHVFGAIRFALRGTFSKLTSV
jgi:hypothetical protein